MKKLLISFCIICSLVSCAELQKAVNNLPNSVITNADIANALKQALDKGIDKEVTKLTETDGFYKNQLVKITLPAELQKVDEGLRKVGLGNLADEGLKLLNRAAEDAVKEATPIFVNAVQEITFADAKNILLGDDNAATNYLEQKTTTALYNKFSPVINNSLSKVGATEIWSNLISKYNSLPLTNDVNPDLTDYVTNKALDGVFTMIAVEEKEIRTNINERTTTLLQKVFAMQD
ncbi:Protein of unknown function [Pustulibacterium marinum]|uniref:DUF4197 domain-containing protein n=1 Tax=Pustulibacterium marinum TaxID=1224947 RepID=A0A1I7FAR4_9FLAO|nr:DUF4197 domain-containing protein [Pustulibacterium marinum]SFU33269.1 Protein of unknown function [Pustulibacterium marinum]